MSESLFKYDGIENTLEIASTLEALRDGFANGAISLTQGEEQIILTPQGLINITVEAKRKDASCKIKFTLRWKERDEETVETPPLRIKALDKRDA